MSGKVTRSVAERFWEKVSRNAPDDCWLWTGAIYRNGYGSFGWSGKRSKQVNIGAHRAAWKLAYGRIPKGLLVCHSCDTRACCNPKHLFLGTAKDNTGDMIAKGRNSKGSTHGKILKRRDPKWIERMRSKNAFLRGEKHPQTTLTAEQVKAIRRDYASGDFSQSELARKYCLKSQATISHIVNRRTWAHV